MHAAAVLLHDAPRDPQPEAGAQPRRPDHLPERLEDPLHVLRRDPWPAVLDREAEALRRELDRNPDHAVLRRKLHGVGQQVREDLLDALRIRVRVRQAVRRAHLEVQVLLPRRGTERIGGFTDQPRRRFGARLDAQRLAGLEARDVQQVLDQPVHLARRAQDRLQVSHLVLRRQAQLGEHLRRHLHGVQGIAQVVRDDGQDLLAEAQRLPRLAVELRVAHRQRRAQGQLLRELEVVLVVAAAGLRVRERQRSQHPIARPQREQHPGPRAEVQHEILNGRVRHRASYLLDVHIRREPRLAAADHLGDRLHGFDAVREPAVQLLAQRRLRLIRVRRRNRVRDAPRRIGEVDGAPVRHLRHHQVHDRPQRGLVVQ